MKTNFLLFKEAFALDDWSLFVDKFAALNEAILKAKDDNEDEVLLQASLLELEISNHKLTKKLYEIIYTD
ncbi:MAG: hypothetical protein JJT94_05655 [Bernardetiaceae bacterium]|nr:hypothetical protein [Bernardetiaceae bacterium]